MAMVLGRIALRYGAAALVTYGLLSPSAGNSLAVDPDIQVLIGMLLGALAEGWWMLARRRGWER